MSKANNRYTIRPYCPDDLDEVVRIWYEASKVGHPFLSEEQLAADREEIVNKYIPMAKQWVAECDGRVVGFIALLNNFIGGLFVDPAYHRHGVGRRLVEHIRPLYERLTVEVFRENHKARAFYTACGFRVVEEHDNLHTGLPAMTMELTK